MISVGARAKIFSWVQFAELQHMPMFPWASKVTKYQGILHHLRGGNTFEAGAGQWIASFGNLRPTRRFTRS